MPLIVLSSSILLSLHKHCTSQAHHSPGASCSLGDDVCLFANTCFVKDSAS